MAFDAKHWAKVQALYEGGYSLGQITSRPDVVIKDGSLISRRARKLGWKKGQMSILVDMELANIRQKNEINLKKSSLSVEKRLVYEEIFQDRIQHLPALFRAGVEAVKAGVQLLENEKTMANAMGLAKLVKDVASAIEPKQASQVNVGVNQQASVSTNLSEDYPTIEDYLKARQEAIDRY